MAALFRHLRVFVVIGVVVIVTSFYALRKKSGRVLEVRIKAPIHSGRIPVSPPNPYANSSQQQQQLGNTTLDTTEQINVTQQSRSSTSSSTVEERQFLATAATAADDNRIWWQSPREVRHYGINDWSKDYGSTWNSGFCKDFLVNTFDKTSKVCKDDSIVCSGTRYNRHIGSCSLHNLAIKPKQLNDAFALRRLSDTKHAWLVNGACSEHDYGGVDSFMEAPDPFRALVKEVAKVSPQGECQVWVKGTSFFYMGMGDHIYFKMLGWYNLHRSLLKHSNLSSFTIVRLPENKSHYWFLQFERTLFPQSVGIDEFKDDIVCFERVVFVPWTYAATPFRCKMDGAWLKNQCMGCKGLGLETDLLSFRRRMLSACSLHDEDTANSSSSRKKRLFLVIQRKQYIRRSGDSHRKFQRVWKDSNELIDRLRSSFPDDEVVGIYGEDMEMCDQIQKAHDADVLIGMHGAGMVHLWWLRGGTVSFELVPPSQRGNGAFTTLSTLLGKRHYQFTAVTEKGSTVTVDINRFIQYVQSKLK